MTHPLVVIQIEVAILNSSFISHSFLTLRGSSISTHSNWDYVGPLGSSIQFVDRKTYFFVLLWG